MNPVFALRVLALALIALIASQPMLLAYAERAVDPYQALYDWLKKNLVVVGITPYRGVNYPVIGEYREPIVKVPTEPGKMGDMEYSEYLKRLQEGKINLESRLAILDDARQNMDIIDIQYKLNLDPVFLTWGTHFLSRTITTSCPTLDGKYLYGCSSSTIYHVSSAYLMDPSYMYSYITLTNGSKLKLPKGENLILALAFKDMDVGALVSSALGGKHVEIPLNLKNMLLKAPADDPYFGVFLVEWSVKGGSGSLYKVGKGLYRFLKPDVLQVYYEGRYEKGPLEVTGVDFIAEGRSLEPDRLFRQSAFYPTTWNATIFRPIGPPLESVQSLVNINMAPRDAFLASSAMYVIRPEVYSGSDRVEVVISDIRGKIRISLSMEIEVGRERFNIEGHYTFSESKIIKWDKETETHFNTWDVRAERIGYDEYGSLRLRITINHAYSIHYNLEGEEKFSHYKLGEVTSRSYGSTIRTERMKVEGEISIGGYTLNPAPPHGVITMLNEVAEITLEEQGSWTFKRPEFFHTLVVEPKYTGYIVYYTRSNGSSGRFEVTYYDGLVLSYEGEQPPPFCAHLGDLNYCLGGVPRTPPKQEEGFIGEYQLKGIRSGSASFKRYVHLFLYYEGDSLSLAISTSDPRNEDMEFKETSYWTDGYGTISSTRYYDNLGCGEAYYTDVVSACVTLKFNIATYSYSYYEQNDHEVYKVQVYFDLPKGARGSVGGALSMLHPLKSTPPTRMALVTLSKGTPEERTGASGPMALAIRAEDDLISGRKGIIEARLYGDRVSGIPVDMKAELSISFTKREGHSFKPYNKSLEIALEPPRASTDESGRALFQAIIPSVEELRKKLDLSEEELEQIKTLSIAILWIEAKAGDLEAREAAIVVVSGVYAKINLWDVGIPLPRNLWGEETVTGYIEDRYLNREELVKKYKQYPDLKVKVEIESLDGEIKVEIVESKTLKAVKAEQMPGYLELKQNMEYRVSYKMMYGDRVVLEARDVARFKLGNGSEGLEIVEVDVYIPASLYTKYMELKQILESTTSHTYMIPLGDPALVLTVLQIRRLAESLAGSLGITVSIDDWGYLKPKLKIPDWGDKDTELEVFREISYLDPRFNLTAEALNNPESHWSKMAKLIILMAEITRTYRYTLSLTKAFSILASLLILLHFTKGLFSWYNKPNLLKDWSIGLEKSFEKLPKPISSVLLFKAKDVRQVKTVKVTALVTEGAILATLALVWPDLFKLIQSMLSKSDALTISMYIAALFKITRFFFVLQQGLADFINDLGFEVAFQALVLIIAHTTNAVFNGIVQGIIDSEVLSGNWASREEESGALSSASLLSSLEKTFNDVADIYLKVETVTQLALSILRGVDGILEIQGDRAAFLKSQHRTPDWLVKFTNMPVDRGFKTSDVTSKLYLSFVALLASDVLVKIPWLYAFKAALIGEKKPRPGIPGIPRDQTLQFIATLTITLQAIVPALVFLFTARSPAKTEGSPSERGESFVSLSAPGDSDVESLKSSLSTVRILKPRILESLQLSTYDIGVLAELSNSIDSASKTLMRLSYRTQDLRLKMVFEDHYSALMDLASYLEDIVLAIAGTPGFRPTEEHVDVVSGLIDSIELALEDSIKSASEALKSGLLKERVEEAAVFINSVSVTPEGWLEVEVFNIGDVGANVRVDVLESDVLGSASSEVSLGARSSELVILKPEVRKKASIASVTLKLDVNGVSSTYNVDVLLEPRLELSVFGDTVVLHDGLVNFEGGRLRVSDLTFASFIVGSPDSRFIVYLDGSPVRTSLIRIGNTTLVSAGFTRPVKGILEVKAVESRVEVVNGSGVLETSLGVSIVSDGVAHARVEMLKDNPYPEAGLGGGGNTVVYSLDVRSDRPVRVVVNLDVLGVSDVSQVKVYKYSSTREAYVEVEDYVVDAKSRTVTFTLKPGDPVVAITSMPIKVDGKSASIVYTTGKVRPPQLPELQDGGVRGERSVWPYVALAAAAIAIAFIALTVLARFRRRS